MLSNSTPGKCNAFAAFINQTKKTLLIRLFLVCFAITVFGLFSSVAQTVTTDKADYVPGDVLRISGNGWEPGETVLLHIDETPVFCTSQHNLTATADANGEISNNSFVFNQKHLGVSFVLTATGQSSRLSTQAFFSDGPTHLVISQVYGGGGNSSAPYQNDFVEIFNPTAATVNIAGWSIQYASASGTNWAVTSLSGNIAAGKYYLVKLASGGAVGASITGDVTNTSVNMSATAGKVALVNSSTALTGGCPTGGVVDFVGFGTTADCREGSGTTSNAPAGSNQNSIFRNSNGCIDSDNNASDFFAAPASPRNSFSAANSCDAIGYANLQFPASATINMGKTATVYARVYVAGITEAAGAGPGIAAWIGYSSTNSNPNSGSFTWIPATFNVQSFNNDEWKADIGNSLPAGTYYYASRFQLNGGAYSYGGYNTSGGGFWDGSNNVSGILTVVDATVDFGNIQFPPSGSIATTGSIDIYAQAYKAGLTEAAGQGSGLSAWIGYSTSNSNPETFTNWVPASFHVQAGNNDEFKATLSNLPVGTYYYSSRFQIDGGSYRYGGYNGGFWDGSSNVNGVLTVTCFTAAPSGNASQTFYNSGTVADLVATGTAIKWYSTASSVTPLASNISLINGAHYYATQTLNGCESNSRLDVTANIIITEVDYANLQYPGTAIVNTGNNVTVYAQVYENGVTEAAGQGAGILAWIGYSTNNTDPSTWTNWVPATFNVQVGNNDEYMVTFGSNLPAGTYYFASRFQLTGGPYKYGGYNASGGGFWNGTSNVSGVLTVNCTAPATPTISASGSTTICSGGSVQLTSSYASGNLWSTGATTQSITVTTGGSYSVTHTNSYGCSAISAATTVTVNQTPATPTINANGPTTFCDGGNVTLTSSSTSGNIWSTGATTQSIVVSMSSSYTVSTTLNGCPSASSAPMVVTVNTFSSATTVFVESIGTVSGTTSIASHETANGFDNDDFTMSGNSDVRNTSNSNGYSGASGGANIFLAATPGTNFQIADVNTTGLTNLILSFGVFKSTTTSSGSDLIVETSSDGVLYTPLSYSALPTGTGTADWFYRNTTGSIPATTNLRIRFRQNGTATQYRIDDVSLLGYTSSATISKSDNCGGTATLKASVGNSYLWSTGATSQTITVAAGGNYSVTVTNASGCTSSASTAVSVVAALTASSSQVAAIQCNGGTTSVNVTATGGTAPYTGTGTFSVSGGSYSFLVTDSKGCTSTTSGSISQPSAILLSSTNTPILCNGGTSTVTIIASGGTAPYTGVGNFNQSAGTVNYNVTDANNCTKTIAVTIIQPTVLVATETHTNALCSGGTSGTAKISASGGTAPYTGTGTFTGLAAGTYNYIVKDANSCEATVTVSIGEPPVITLTSNQTNVTCNGGNNGSIDLSVSGGIPGEPLVVTENFDGLLSTGTANTWIDGTTISNWYTYSNGTAGSFSTYAANSGTATSGGLYSFGTTTDRAIGSLVTNGTGDIIGALKVTNNKGYPMTSITVAYTGEQWRNNGNSDIQTLAFDYQVNPSSINVTTGWTAVPALNFNSPIHTATASVLDGNLAANRTQLSSTFAISLQPGESIWLRWRDANDAGNDHALAIDDLTATLKGVTSNSAYTYLWTPGNATTEDVSSLSSGPYTVTVKDGNNCQATKTITITQPDPITSSESAMACDSYTWSKNGETYSASGTYTYVSQNANGCTVTATLNLIVNNSTIYTTTETACDTYTWSGPLGNGQTYTTGGTYTNVTTNAAGCNHTETLVLTIRKSTSGTTTASACDSYTWSGPLGNGQTYTTAGTYTHVTTNAAGCNHTETLVLTIKNSTSGSTTASACDSYTWSGPLGNGQTYTTGGTYTNVTTNAAGCNHTETLVLTIRKSTSGTTTASACDSYTWSGPLGNGQTYTTGGTYTNMTTNAAGCNHTETLVLTIKNSTSGSTTASACDSYTWSGPLGNGQTYTMGGTYTNVTTNAAGCNHTETLVLTIKNSTSGTTTVSACDSYTWSGPLGNGQTYTTGGSYTNVTTNAAGCNHIETLVLTIKQRTSGTTTASACDSYTWSGPLGNGQTYTTAGTYTNVTTNAAGCSHTETLVLTINKSSTSEESASACDSYLWNGTIYTTTGDYTTTSVNAAGCTHTAVLHLTIKKSTSNTTTISTCNSYTWAALTGTGLTYTTSGTYTKTSVNAAGCNHTEILVLSINPQTNPNATGSSTPVQIGSNATLTVQLSTAVSLPVTFNVYNESNTQVFTSNPITTSSAGYATTSVPSNYINAVGVYKVVVKVSNACNDSGKAFFPVFDPTESFVTGGGWINSPIVTEAQYMQVAGIANFGFVSKYKKGTTQVDGNTEFQFQAGNLNFKSTSHETGSLVISGGRATYRGSGTINNVAGYKFVIVAIDGDWNGGNLPDRFRIKIIRTLDGATVYDNQYGKDENTSDATALGNNGTGGGSIVIHEVKATGKKVAVVDYAGAQTLEVKTANNPSLTGEAFILKFRSDDLRTPIDLKVLDASGKPIEQRQHILPGATLHIGRSYTSGLYFAEASQNGRRVILKLLRQ